MNSEAASPNSAQAAQLSQTTQIKFTGSAGTYFGIWITNILLTMLTLGIYSAWAKVRTKKYFHTHTIIAGACFDYHARPLSILKGRVIGVLLYIVYGAVSEFSPAIALVLLAILFIVSPWIIVQSMKFNLRNTSYRGVRFNFVGTLSESFRIFLLLPVLLVFTLGLIFPYLGFRAYKFSINNTRFGTASFSTAVSAGKFYLIYLQVVGLFAVLAAVLATLFVVVQKIAGIVDHMLLISFLPLTLLFFILFIPSAFIKARVRNAVYSATSIQKFGFVSTMRARDLIWIYLSNFFAIMFSFGLLIPWTKIRLARYTADHLVINGGTDFNEFIGLKIDDMSAAGQEIGDFFDVDLPVIV